MRTSCFPDSAVWPCSCIFQIWHSLTQTFFSHVSYSVILASFGDLVSPRSQAPPDEQGQPICRYSGAAHRIQGSSGGVAAKHVSLPCGTVLVLLCRDGFLENNCGFQASMLHTGVMGATTLVRMSWVGSYCLTGGSYFSCCAVLDFPVNNRLVLMFDAAVMHLVFVCSFPKVIPSAPCRRAMKVSRLY